MNRLQPAQRCHIRHIVLREDYKSVSRPESHVRGFVPFCKENPKLRIERRIGLWTNLFPECWKGIYDCSYRYFIGKWILAVFATWIEEASLLTTTEVAPGAFSLIIEGTSEESIQAWDTVKYAAGLQEAMTESFRRRGMSLPLHVQDSRFLRDDCPLPCHLPLCFAPTIRDIIQGASIIRFDGYTGELWDTEGLIQTRQHWTVDDWRVEWQPHVLRRIHDTELSRQLPSRYWLPEDVLTVAASTTTADAAAEASANTETSEA